MVSIDDIYRELKKEEESKYAEGEPLEPSSGFRKPNIDKKEIRKTLQRTNKKISSFAKFLIHDKRPRPRYIPVIRTTRNRSENIGSRSGSELPVGSSGSLIYPEGRDISLSGAIRSNRWSGSRNLMNTKFFSDELDDKMNNLI